MEISAPNPLGFSGKNRVINGNFAFNQRGYASGGALASNAFGHDRWRDGAGGSSYTFTQASQSPGSAHTIDTLVTITSGQLTQPVEITEGGTFVLTWQGTSIANLSGTSGITGPSTGLTSPAVVTLPAGVTVYVNFGPGTLGLVQLETGTTPTPFERRPISVEIALCFRYYFQTIGAAVYILQMNGYSDAANRSFVSAYLLPVPMRATPTMGLIGTYTTNNCNAPSIGAGNAISFVFYTFASAAGYFQVENPQNGGYYASAEL